MRPMHTIRNGFPGALCALLFATRSPCHADSTQLSAPVACQGDCPAVSLIDDCWQPAQAYPANLVPPRIESNEGAVAHGSRNAVMDWQPPNTHWYAKLRGMRELPLVTLWKSDGARVFLGVNSRGVPGIALSSRRPPGPGKKNRNDGSGDWRRQQSSLIYY